MTWPEKYIEKETIEKLNKYQKLIVTTEYFANLLNFLRKYRNYNNLKLKIGYIEYDDWSADLYCVLENNKIYFKHIRREDNQEFKHKTLTEQLIYAWFFNDDMLIEIDYNIINNYWKILNDKDKRIYDELVNDTHCMFW